MHQLRQHRQKLLQRERFILANVVGPSLAHIASGQFHDRLYYIFTIDVTDRQPVAFRYHDWATILQAQKVSVNAIMVISLTVHHGEAQAGEWKFLFGPGSRKNVFRSTLIKTIEPVAMRRFV